MAKKKEVEPELDDNMEFPYNVQSIADRMELAPASVRVKLRNAEIPKIGKMYGWKTKREFEEVVKELESTPSTPIETKPAKKAKSKKEEAKPVKKTTLKRKRPAAAEGDEAAA